MCSTDNFLLLNFLRACKVWSLLHHGSLEQVQSRECYIMFKYTSLGFFCCFSSKKCVFIIFISFFDKLSNFCNRILANQKPKSLKKNCLWSCMLMIFPGNKLKVSNKKTGSMLRSLFLKQKQLC